MTQIQKEHIVEQAAKMFALQGIKSVRMDDIATELSISKRTLYALFGDKEELIYLSLLYWLDHQREEHLRIMESSENELEALFRILKGSRNDSAIGQRMESNLKKFYPAVHDRISAEGWERSRQGLKNILARGIEKGIFRADINIDLTINIFSTVGCTILQRGNVLIPENLNNEEAVMEVISILFRGIASAKGLEIIEKHTAHPGKHSQGV